MKMTSDYFGNWADMLAAWWCGVCVAAERRLYLVLLILLLTIVPINLLCLLGLELVDD